MLKITVQPDVIVTLTPDEARLFDLFKERYELLAHLLGILDGMGIRELRNASLTLDIDASGRVGHTSLTKHFRSVK